ncbi:MULTISPECIES: PAS domain-containing protein [unclassified Thioalkalivibrio]|uniref:PAS domain-containing protein n=1 Tax=unclassified Thioalkalivibrio TaxID=2621013 RepID=UPI000381D080|nr:MULTISPECIES: PAS domain-containing protein [unclassified Thioalkalivibrio]
MTDALGELQRQFVEALPARLKSLHSQYQKLDPAGWQPFEAQALHHQIHSLTGSAGTFGLQSVSAAARQLEIRLKAIVEAGAAPDADVWATIGAELVRIEALALSRLQADAPSLTPPETPPRPDRAPWVYLVEDDAEQAAYLAQTLGEDGYRIRLFTSLDDFHATFVEDEAPDAIVLDMSFPEGDDAGAALLAELQAGGEGCPPVVFVSVRDDLKARLAAFRAGASRYLLKPVDPRALIDLLDALTGRMPLQPYRVLLVDDDPVLLEAQSSVLRAAGMTVQALDQPLDTLEILDAFRPDVVVLDVYMPDIRGPELAHLVRERDDYLTLPILFLSAETDMSLQLEALQLGGDDFLVKPVQAEHLIAAVTARARRSRQNVAVQRRLANTLYEREREHLALDHHAIVSMADSAGNITYVNDKFCEISGYRRGELIGHNHRILKSEEHPPVFFEAMWETISAGHVWQGEICNRAKDGSLYWVESTITPFMDSEGLPYQYVSMRTEITHVKAAEAEQRAQNALRAVIGEATSSLLAADADSLDTALEHVLSLTAQHLGADRAYLLLLSEDGTRIGNGSQEWCAAGVVSHHAVLLGTPLTALSWWSTHLQRDQPVIVPDVAALPPEAAAEKAILQSLDVRAFVGFPIRHRGQALGSLCFDHQVGVDPDSTTLELLGLLAGQVGSALLRRASITERKLAEQAAETAKARLNRGQQFANVGTWEWNIVTGDLIWTDRIAPLFGYPEGDLETSYDNFLGAIHPEDRQAVIDAVDACVAHDAPYDIEHRVVWPDGTVRWLLERGAVVRDTEGRALRMLGVVQDIDDRKCAETALAEREQQLLEAQGLASLGNWQLNLISGELSWSDEVYRIFGYEPGSMAPSLEAFQAAVHPDDRQLVRDSELEAEKTGRHDVIHRIIRPDGSIRHVHELAQAETDAEGSLVRLSGTVQDVTDRVETEQRFSFAVEGAGDGVWDWDVKTGRMTLSGHYELMLGYQPGELEPSIEVWKTSIHPDDRERAQQWLLEYLEGRRDAFHVEMRLRCKDGTYKWVLCRGTVVQRDAGDEPVRLVGIHSDIDVRKAAEETLQIFKHVVNSVLDGVLVIDPEGVIQLASPAAAAIFGHDQQAMVGNNVSMLMPEPVRSSHDAYLQRYLATREAHTINRQVEVTGQRADGAEFPMEVSVSELDIGEGTYFVGLLRDISARKQAEEELVTARVEADRANQAKSEFLSSMSHELRTPMNAILGFGQLLEYDDSLGQEPRENVHEILRAGKHLLELINEVLDLAKVESGKIELSMEPVELCPVIQECLSLVGTTADKRDIHLRHRGIEGARVRADHTRLKQVLLNLLSNAIKYNSEGGTVTLEVQREGDARLHIRVTDTGKGIPEDKLTELFQPFSRLDAENSEIEGTGIGLTITRRIVEAMGGSMGVQSEVGVGSTFWLELSLDEPVSQTSAERVASAPVVEAAGRERPEDQCRTVLYIEDNPANIRLMEQIVGQLPQVHLLTAHTAALGIELALTRRPDLILLDINLPGMDGYRVLEAFKAEAGLELTPVIAITANAMPRDIERGMAAGFVDYLTKPLDVDRFLDTLQRHLAEPMA